MQPIRVNPLGGFLNFLQVMASGNPHPDKQITDKVAGITIDTSYPKDSLIWETGIKRPALEGKWVIVEQYQDEAHAVEGHKKWLGLMEEFPDFPLKDIDLWDLESYKEEVK